MNQKLDIIEKAKYASRHTDVIMIHSHFTICHTVYRKPIFKDDKVYVRYFKKLYEVISYHKVYIPEGFNYKLYVFNIDY